MVAACPFGTVKNQRIKSIIFLQIEGLFLILQIFYPLRKALSITGRIFLGLIIAIILLYGSLHLPSVQTWLIQKTASRVSRELGTEVSISRLDFHFFDKVSIEKILIRDKQKDTLLYAGSIQVNLNDWFFFKERIDLKYIGLEDAFINLYRKDTVWNYRFIEDYFSDTTSSSGGGGKTNLDIRKIRLSNVRILQRDQWVGQDMTVSFRKLDLAVNTFDPDNKKIDLAELRIVEPFFWQFEYPGNKPKGYRSAYKPPKPTQYKWNDGEWVITMDQMQMLDGSIRIDKETDHEAYNDRFDGEHLIFTGLQGNIRNLRLHADTIKMNLDLKGEERSGLRVKKLAADVRFTPDIMEFNKLDLQTNRSRLGDYYAMRYNDFEDDMSDYISAVIMEGKFRNSELHSDDLAFFDPSVSDLNRVFYFSGDAEGTVENLSARNLKIKTGRSYLEGDLQIMGLPDTDSTFIKLAARDLQTNYQEIASIAPAIKEVKAIRWQETGNLSYRGNFEGNLYAFKAAGTVSSALGSISCDIGMQLPDKGLPRYDGYISTGSFDIGRLTGNKQWGIIALDGKIKGSGFEASLVNADFNGKIDRLGFNGYDYRNMVINGNFSKSLFTGKMNINDPNIRVSEMDGKLNLSRKDIAFNLDASIEHIDLQALKLVDRDMDLSGKFSLDFTGNNIDNFSGSARIFAAKLRHNDKDLSFDSLELVSFIQDDKKNLSLHTNEADAEISGQFSILELPAAFLAFLHNYYPGYITAPAAPVANQQFNFRIRTREPEEFLKIVDPRLGGLNRADISGSLDLAGNILEMKAQVPKFIYDGTSFSKISISALGNRDKLKTEIDVDDIALNDSLHFPGTRLNISSENDISVVNLRTTASEALNEANLNTTVYTSPDSIRFYFSPSSFIINNKKWTVKQDGELIISNNKLFARDISITESFQSIRISSELKAGLPNPVLKADIENLILEDLVPYLFKDPELSGRLTGHADIADPLGQPLIEFSGRSENLYMNRSYLGHVDLSAKANTQTGLLDFKGSTSGSDNDFNISGNYNYLDSTGKNMLVALKGSRVNLKVLEPYMEGIFSTVEGTANTDLSLFNEDGESYLTGQVQLTDAALEVEYTRCKYFIRNEPLYFNKDAIEIRNIRLYDSLGHTGSVSGKILHKFFDDFSFRNIRFETPRMLLLNTSRTDNELFYGHVTGSAIMTLNGPVSNMVMTIDGQPGIIDSSHLFLPSSESKESNVIDYIEFKEYGTDPGFVPASWNNDAMEIIVDMNIKANPACKVDVILDEATGDIIRGSGNGSINIRVGNREPLSVRGRYELTTGEYTFNFQTFFKKPFELTRGNLTWNGDPYEAIIDIDAEYVAKNVNVSNIVPSGGFKQKDDIIIVSHLKGNLSQPAISFEFRVPEKSELNRDYITMKRLADLQKDETEMNKQVASLLLFNTFLTESQNFFSGENTMAFATSTVGGIISNWLTNIFNKELERATKGMVSTYIDINPSLSLQKNASELQANVRAGLKLLLSNRLVFLLGGNLEYNNPYILERKGLLTPDLTLEWLLNKDGTLRVVGFHRSSIDYSMGLRNRSGAQLSYRKDIDHPGDIFKSKKRLEEERIKAESRSN